MATFGAIASPAPNVLFDPAKVDAQVMQQQRNQLLMESSKQDQAAQMYERDATARIGLAQRWAGASDTDLAAGWGADVQRLQAAGLGHGIDPTTPPPRERLQAIAASDLTTFQRLQLEEKRKEREAWSGMVTGGGTPASVPSVPAAPAAPGGTPMAAAPADLAPIFAAASRDTNIPVPLLMAVAQQESQMGRDPRATANGGGPMQIVGGTARDPGYGLPQISDADRLDPTKAIPWAARYLAARNPGVDWNDPTQRDEALRRYNGGGDPNYAANVVRHMPAGAPAPQPTPPGGVAARTGGTNVVGPGAPTEQPTPQLNARGLTAADEQILLRAGPERGPAMMLQMQQQNRAAGDRARTEAESTRRFELNERQQREQVARQETQRKQDLEYRDAAEKRRADEIARRDRLDAEKANAPVNATEGERKAAGFLGRMQAEEAFIARMVAPKAEGGEEYKPGNLRDRAAAQIPLVGNYLQTEEGQRYLSSGAEWVRAKLRHESGAAIGQAEAIEEAKGYFPMPGDSEKQIEDKKARRAVAIEGLRLASGRLAPKPEGGAGGRAPMSSGDALAAARSKLGAGASDDDVVNEAVRLRGGR